MFWSTWDCPCSFSADLFFNVARCASRVYVLRLRWLSNDTLEGSRTYQRTFAPVPIVQDLLGGSTTKYSWMDETGKPNVWNMARRTKYPFKIPDSLGTAEGLINVSCRRSYLGSPETTVKSKRRHTRLGRYHRETRPHCFCRKHLYQVLASA